MPNFSDNFRYYLQNEAIIDDFSYQYDDDIQDTYVEGGDGGNPVTRSDSSTPNWKVGTTCARFSITDATHSSTWTATLGAQDLSEFVGVATGQPTKGKIKHLITVSSTSQITAISYRIGSDSSNYITWAPSVPGTTTTVAQEGDLSGLTITGTPNWKAIAYVQIRATTNAGTPTIDLSGLRLTASTRVTGGVWNETTTLATNSQSLSFISTRNNYPTLTINGSSATDIITNEIAGLTFNNFTAVVKARFHSASGTDREFGMCFRGSDFTEGSEDFYSVAIDDANSLVRFDKWVGGTRTALQSAALDPSIDTDYWLKLECSGTSVKVYLSTDGLTYTKYVDTTDATFTSGSCGLYVNGTPAAEFYFMQIFDRPYVIFDDWSFAERNMINLVNVQEDSSPVISLQHVSLANLDRDTFVNKNFRSKFIQVRGNITTSTVTDLKNTIDNIKEHVSRENRILRVGKERSTAGVFDERVYTVNAINLDQSLQRETWHKTYMPFNITFQAPDGIAKAPSAITIPSFTWDEYTFTRYISFKGSAGPLPVITYNLTDATPASGSINTISFTNSYTSRSIVVTKSSAFANADVVVIDFANQVVTINGTQSDYTGILNSGFFVSGQNKVVTTITASSSLDQQNGPPTSSYVDKYVLANYNDNTADTYYAQSFQVSTSTTYPIVEMYMFYPPVPWPGHITNPWATSTLEVQTNNAGSPSGSLVNAGATASITTGAETTSWLRYTLSTTATLSSGTTYWLVLKPGSHPFTEGGLANAGTFRATTNSGYSSGSIKYSANSGTSWTADDSTQDLSFKIYAAGPTAISGTFSVSYQPRYV